MGEFDAAIADEIVGMFRARGDAEYGEQVSQTEHAIECALAAELAGSTPSLVVAALLHDIGHLLFDGPEDVAEHGVDDRHEQLGADWLAVHFGPEVVEPIRLHVAAKRYLCATDPAYHATLSPASVLSLDLQGGPMTADEIGAFEANPYFQEAVALRRFDEIGKVVGMVLPAFAAYRDRIAALAA